MFISSRRIQWIQKQIQNNLKNSGRISRNWTEFKANSVTLNSKAFNWIKWNSREFDEIEDKLKNLTTLKINSSEFARI